MASETEGRGGPTVYPSFNLVDEGWVPVTLLDGGEAELSLREVFQRAKEVRCLSCELPTMDLAVLRMLLAVTERALALRYDEYDEEDAVGLWARFWNAGELPLDLVEEYLDTWYDRFGLFDGEHPFMQVPDLTATNGKVADARKLRSASENKAQLFPMALENGGDRTRCSPEAPLSMGPGEAARWLLHVQAFDTGGIKTGMVGDPKVKGGKRHGSSPGWLGNVGPVYVEGGSLLETLLLNLHLGRSSGDADTLFDPDDLPAWEREPDGWSSERVPSGFADVYTWQSRRVRLVPDDEGRVTGVVLTYGNPLDYVNRQELEPMSSWRRSKDLEKRRQEAAVYVPVRHDPSRTLWRGLESLLPSSDGSADTLMPGVLRWLGALSTDPDVRLPKDAVLRVRAVGLVYGTQNACVTDSADDALGIPVALLDPSNEALVALVRHCVGKTQEAVRAFGWLGSDLVKASGGGPDPCKAAAASARSEAYFDLGQRFTLWLGSLGIGTDPVRARDAWFDTARRALLSLASRYLSSVDDRALVGRTVDDRWCSAVVAERTFINRLGKVLPRDTDEKEVDGGDK